MKNPKGKLKILISRKKKKIKEYEKAFINLNKAESKVAKLMYDIDLLDSQISKEVVNQ